MTVGTQSAGPPVGAASRWKAPEPGRGAGAALPRGLDGRPRARGHGPRERSAGGLGSPPPRRLIQHRLLGGSAGGPASPPPSAVDSARPAGRIRGRSRCGVGPGAPGCTSRAVSARRLRSTIPGQGRSLGKKYFFGESTAPEPPQRGETSGCIVGPRGRAGRPVPFGGTPPGRVSLRGRLRRAECWSRIPAPCWTAEALQARSTARSSPTADRRDHPDQRHHLRGSVAHPRSSARTPSSTLPWVETSSRSSVRR
jgi:hypothetical protein